MFDNKIILVWKLHLNLLMILFSGTKSCAFKVRNYWRILEWTRNQHMKNWYKGSTILLGFTAAVYFVGLECRKNDSETIKQLDGSW